MSALHKLMAGKFVHHHHQIDSAHPKANYVKHLGCGSNSLEVS